MTFNQIRYYLEVAQCLNFSTAARRLFMTQPALGRQMTALETELNMQLFIRSTHGLQLTPAGIYLQQQWSKEITQFDSTILQAKQISEGYSGKLVVGILEGIDAGSCFADIVSAFEQNYPHIRLDLKRYGFRPLRDQLYQGKLDAIITYSLDLENRADISYIPIIKLHPVWVVPKTNPLSEKESIHCKDLKNEELVLTDIDDTSFGKNVTLHLCQQYGGFYPKLFFVDSVDEIILRVETSNRCALMSRELTISKSDKVKLFPLLEEDRNLKASLAWKDDNTNIALQLFRNTAEKLIHN